MRGVGAPLKLAEVDTSGRPRARHNAAEKRSRVSRTPKVPYGVYGAFERAQVADQRDESLVVAASFDRIYAVYRLLICGIAPDAPDGVRGVEDKSAVPQHFYGFAQVFYECIVFVSHNTKLRIKSSIAKINNCPDLSRCGYQALCRMMKLR